MQKRLFWLLSMLSLIVFMTTLSSAQEMAQKAATHGMMKGASKDAPVTVIVRHAVKEYASWRKVYDADESNRKKMGFKVWGVYADANDPNMVSIIGTFPSASAADAFMSSPKLKEAMGNAGVVGAPVVTVMKAMPK